MCSKLKTAARKLVLLRKGQGQKIIKGTATQLCDLYIYNIHYNAPTRCNVISFLLFIVPIHKYIYVSSNKLQSLVCVSSLSQKRSNEGKKKARLKALSYCLPSNLWPPIWTVSM